MMTCPPTCMQSWRNHPKPAAPVMPQQHQWLPTHLCAMQCTLISVGTSARSLPASPCLTPVIEAAPSVAKATNFSRGHWNSSNKSTTFL
ncbi:hypothetical protein M758_8G151400 [Ceratodon purpureus]|nr:hypothetical protein M758_8G151400 [Ceratodon purpureus]